jgi:hypothetical protein
LIRIAGVVVGGLALELAGLDAANSYRAYIEWIRETLDRPTVYSDIFELAEIMKIAVAKIGQPRRPIDE